MGSLRSSAQAHILGHLATEPLAANRNHSSNEAPPQTVEHGAQLGDNEARRQAELGIVGSGMEGHGAMDMSITDGPFLRRLFSARAFTAISHYFYMDIHSPYLDLGLGFLIAGALAVAVLWNGGISSGGVISFIFAGLIKGSVSAPTQQLLQLARRRRAALDKVSEVVSQVSACSPDLGEDRPAGYVPEQAPSVELRVDPDEGPSPVEWDHRPGAARGGHECRHAAGLIGQRTVRLVVGDERLLDLGQQRDAELADASGDRGGEGRRTILDLGGRRPDGG